MHDELLKIEVYLRIESILSSESPIGFLLQQCSLPQLQRKENLFDGCFINRTKDTRKSEYNIIHPIKMSTNNQYIRFGCNT